MAPTETASTIKKFPLTPNPSPSRGEGNQNREAMGRRILRWVRLPLLLVAFFLILEIVRVTTGPNWHTLVPGELYRSAQLSESELYAAVNRFGLKTILNLRAACPWEPWYQEETRVVKALGLNRVDLNFSAYLPPAPQEMQKLWNALETAPRPILIHCRRGADRTGLTSVITMLHRDDSQPVELSRQHLSVRAGHAFIGRVEAMGEVLDTYEQWLGQKQLTHSRDVLKRYLFEDYRPGQVWAAIEPLSVPEQLQAGEPFVVKVRVHNRAHQSWQFQRGANVGMHVRGWIQPKGAKAPPGSDPMTDPIERRRVAAGFVNVTVPPGGFIDVDVPLPAMKEPGLYSLYLDIFDEQRRCFGEVVGSPPFKRILELKSAPLAQR